MKKLLFLIAGFLLLSFGVASAFPLFPSSGDYAPGTGIGPIPGTKFEDNNLDFFCGQGSKWFDHCWRCFVLCY